MSQTLANLRDQTGSPWDGILVELVNPLSGRPVFPTLTDKAQLLRPSEATLPVRHTASTVYTAPKRAGVLIPCWQGVGEIARRRLLCAPNQPLYRIGCTRGGGTHAASFSKRSHGDSWRPRVPSGKQGVAALLGGPTRPHIASKSRNQWDQHS